MSRRPRVEAIATRTYRAEGEFPCALYEADSGCAGMTDKKNYCYGCRAYICTQCDQINIDGEHEPQDHKRS